MRGHVACMLRRAAVCVSHAAQKHMKLLHLPAVLAVLLTAQAWAAPQLTIDNAYISVEESSGGKTWKALLAPNFALADPLANTTTAGSPEACSRACRLHTRCTSFNFCGQAVSGC